MIIKPGYIVLLSKYQVFKQAEQMSDWVYNHFEEVDDALVIKVPKSYCDSNGNPEGSFSEDYTDAEYSNTNFRVGDIMFDIRDIVRVLYPYN